MKHETRLMAVSVLFHLTMDNGPNSWLCDNCSPCFESFLALILSDVFWIDMIIASLHFQYKVELLK